MYLFSFLLVDNIANHAPKANAPAFHAFLRRPWDGHHPLILALAGYDVSEPMGDQETSPLARTAASRFGNAVQALEHNSVGFAVEIAILKVGPVVGAAAFVRGVHTGKGKINLRVTRTAIPTVDGEPDPKRKAGLTTALSVFATRWAKGRG